jgi:hypothetical protein
MYRHSFVLIPSHSASSETQVFYLSSNKASSRRNQAVIRKATVSCDSVTNYPRTECLETTTIYLLVIL